MKKRLLKKAFAAVFLAALAVASFAMPAIASSTTLYEKYNLGDDGGATIYGMNWYAQTFTADATAHTANSIRLKLYRVLEPGTVTVSIRATDDSGHPTGTDLTSGTISGDAIATTPGDWYEFSLTQVNLEASTKYAILVRAVAGDAANYIVWRYDGSTPTLDNGNYESSTNGGVSWTADTAKDFMFEVWGYSVFEVIEARVFAGYIEDGDWLLVFQYGNIYPPYYPLETPQEYFNLQLINLSSEVVAQTKLPAWGNKPGSIYLSVGAADALEWGAAYKIRMKGRFDPYPSTEYTLQTADWLGEDLRQLDQWVISVAGAIGSYYNVLLTTYIEGVGQALNTEGAAIFSTGIPGLSSVRPGLFTVVLHELGLTEEEWTGAYQATLEDNLGPEIAGILEDVGDIVNLDGNAVGGLFLVISYLAVASIIVMGTGKPIVGAVLAFPTMLAGAYLELLPVAALAIMGSLATIAFIWLVWFKST